MIEFHRSENISRPCPGIREFRRIKINGEYEKVQRRLILVNLNEAFEIFKQENPGDKIGFSKFASVKPEECVLAGSTHGIHTTCVCVKHQNVKLTFDSIKSQFNVLLTEKNIGTYRDLINILLCKQVTQNCRLNECKKCSCISGNEQDEGLQSILHQIIDDSIIENISVKQWISNSKTMEVSRMIDNSTG